MKRNIHTPSYPLSRFVDLIWVDEAAFLNLCESSYPFLQTELIFTYGDRFHVEGENVIRFKNTSGEITLSGLKNQPFSTKVNGVYAAIGLFLKPFCYGFLQQHNNSQKLDELTGVLCNYLFGKKRPDFPGVENHLVSLFRDCTLSPALLSFQNRTDSRFLQKGVLGNEIDSLPVSQKHFINLFKRHYGLTPLQFIKLKQVNRAIGMMKSDKEKNLTEIGLKTGFYDQSHFTRVFSQYCGKSPKTFRKLISKN